MRRTYHDITEMVKDREVPSLQRYIPAEAKYASVREGEGWLTLVEAPEYWHAALVDVGFHEATLPDTIAGLEFMEASHGTH